MESNCFYFCQNDFLSSSSAAFEVMKQNRELIDFVATINNRNFFAHRVVLAAGIPYLRSVFANCMSEIPINVIDPDAFEDVINFAYTGKIKISMRNVQQLLAASQSLHLTQIHEACIKFLCMQININNVLEFLAFAERINSLRLAAACDLFILRNFEEFAREKFMEFLQLPFQYLKDLISRDDLNVVKEETVFEAVIKWVEACPTQRHHLLPELLSSVCMTSLEKQYLVERVSTESLITASSLCKCLVEKTKNYHLLPKKESSSSNIITRNSTAHGLYAVCQSCLGQCVELYDVSRDMWITLAKISSQKIINVVGCNGKIYFFEINAKMILTFDAKTFKIEELNTSLDNLRPRKDILQVVLHNNKLYVFTANEIYSFDPLEMIWMGLKVEVDCNQSGIASFGEYIYITGGCFRGSEARVCKRYSPSSGKLNEISSMLRRRWGHACAGLNGKVYVCGGSVVMKSEVYDPLTDHWSYISPRRIASRGVSLVSYRGKLCALSNSVANIYDPEQDIWHPGIPLPSCCKHIKYVTIPPPEDEKGCPEFSDLRLQLQAGFSTGR